MVLLNVEGMKCQACEMIIKDALEEVGARRIEVSAKKGTVNILYTKLSIDCLKSVIRNQGFEVQ